MTSLIELLDKCPVCAHSSAHARLRFVKHDLKIFACEDCGSLFVNPQPPADTLKEMYTGANYFQGGGFDGYGYSDYQRMAHMKERTFLRWLNDVERFVSTGNMLDIGCATGLMMDIAQKSGWSTIGIELSDYAADRARQRGLEVYSERLETLRLPEGDFDAVLMLDLLEHIPDPISMLQRARRLIRPGGILYAVTPNVRSFSAQVQRANWPHLKPQEHLCLFSKRGIRRSLERAGFELVALDRARKVMTFAHIIDELSATNPAAIATLRTICAVVPFLRNREFFLSLGEMRIVARNPAG